MDNERAEAVLFGHYIRTNQEGLVVHAFTTAFENPIDGDILLFESPYRLFDSDPHLQILPLIDASKDVFTYRWKWDGYKIVPSEPVENEEK